MIAPDSTSYPYLRWAQERKDIREIFQDSGGKRMRYDATKQLMQNQILIMQALSMLIHVSGRDTRERHPEDDTRKRIMMADMTTRISETMGCLREREESST